MIVLEIGAAMQIREVDMGRISVANQGGNSMKTRLSIGCLILGFALAACANEEHVSSTTSAPAQDDDHEVATSHGMDADEFAPTGLGATFFNNPRASGGEPDGKLIGADFSSGHIVRVDRETGDRQLLSDNQDDSQGPVFVQPAGIAILPDGRIFIADLALNRVYEVDRVTGQRTSFSLGDESAIKQPFGASAGMVNGQLMLVVADTGSDEGGSVVGPVLVDIVTGEVIPIPRPDDTSIEYNDPRSIQVIETPDAPNGESYLIVGNFGDETIVTVDPTTGVRTMLSDSSEGGVGDGVRFISITDIALSKDKSSIMILDLAQEAVIDVDLSTGHRQSLTQSHFGSVGSGFDMLNPHGIVAVEGGGYMVTDFGAPGVLYVSETGARERFSVTPVRGFNQIRGIDLLENGNYAVADFGGERLIIVDGETGERTVLTGAGNGDGPKLNGPVSVDELDDNTLIVSEFSSQSILFVDRKTGNRSYLTSTAEGGRGSGPTLGTRGLTIDPHNSNRVFATDFANDAVFAIDIETGNRSIYSSAFTDTPRGEGPTLNNPFGIDVADDGTIYVSDMGLRAVFAIDADGNRTIISSNEGKGEGVKFGSPWGLRIMDGDVFVGDGPGVIKVNTETGDRTLVSPGGPIFTLRDLPDGSFAISHIGDINGIQIENAEGARQTLSNFDNPRVE